MREILQYLSFSLWLVSLGIIPSRSIHCCHKWQDFIIFYGWMVTHHYIYIYIYGFPGGSDSKVSVCNAGDLGSIPGSGRSPGEGKWQSTPALLLGKSHGWRSLIGYSPWGCKELDIFFIHSPIDGHWGCFHILAIVKNAVIMEMEMATHSSILAGKFRWTEQPGRLQSIESQKSQTWLRN